MALKTTEELGPPPPGHWAALAAEAPWPQSKEVSEAFEVAPPQWAAWGVLEDGRRKEMREEVLGMAPEAARQRWEARAAEAPWPPSSVPGEAEAPALVRGAALAMWPPCRTPVVEVEVDRHPVSQEEVEEGKALIRPAATPAGKAWPQSLGLAGEEAGRGPVLVESAPAWPALLDSLCCARSVHGYRLANYRYPGRTVAGARCTRTVALSGTVPRCQFIAWFRQLFSGLG